MARQMQFAPGAILVFDRGYTGYQWFANLTKQAVYFVSRLKENADYGVVEKREIPQRRGVLRDEVVFSTSRPSRAEILTSGGSSSTMRSAIAF